MVCGSWTETQRLSYLLVTVRQLQQDRTEAALL